MKKIITLVLTTLLFVGCGLPTTKYVYEVKTSDGRVRNITINKPSEDLKCIGGDLEDRSPGWTSNIQVYAEDVIEVNQLSKVDPTQSEIEEAKKENRSNLVLVLTSVGILILFIISFRNRERIKNNYNKIKSSTMTKILKWMFYVFGIILTFKIGMILIREIPPIIEHYFGK